MSDSVGVFLGALVVATASARDRFGDAERDRFEEGEKDSGMSLSPSPCVCEEPMPVSVLVASDAEAAKAMGSSLRRRVTPRPRLPTVTSAEGLL